ncbi:hypothetical protein EJ08DRAFT_101581 [Tothia fuscella]|uniref:Uncharacterized protein n=1 Tax=Tothia fuscella TaxID=1048955 RepID=A0A9P4NX50_9PEZI|nr:hypothetical protein EJ08DRAFT_101581 [Tothia fuscella]
MRLLSIFLVATATIVAASPLSVLEVLSRREVDCPSNTPAGGICQRTSDGLQCCCEKTQPDQPCLQGCVEQPGEIVCDLPDLTVQMFVAASKIANHIRRPVVLLRLSRITKYVLSDSKPEWVARISIQGYGNATSFEISPKCS